MKKKRLADPYWLRCCELWDKLTEYECAAVLELFATCPFRLPLSQG